MKKAMLFLVMFGLVGSVRAADNPFIGIWKLNIAKSKASDPSAMPKSEVAKNVAQGNLIKTTFDWVDSQGKSYHHEWTGEWNGKDFPVTGDPYSDMRAVKRVDANTIEVVTKKAGKEISTWRMTIPKDGKTMTGEGKFKIEKGEGTKHYRCL